MDAQHRLIECLDLFFGTLSSASVYPREVAKVALEYNAAVVCFAHNHPSGIAEPSQADIRITERLKDALLLFDINTLDHLVCYKMIKRAIQGPGRLLDAEELGTTQITGCTLGMYICSLLESAIHPGD